MKKIIVAMAVCCCAGTVPVEARPENMNHTMNCAANDMLGFEGYSVAANYTFAKNIVGQVFLFPKHPRPIHLPQTV